MICFLGGFFGGGGLLGFFGGFLWGFFGEGGVAQNEKQKFQYHF